MCQSVAKQIRQKDAKNHHSLWASARPAPRRAHPNEHGLQCSVAAVLVLRSVGLIGLIAAAALRHIWGPRPW